MPRDVSTRSRTIPAASLWALALGAAAFGAVAIGALAIGRLAVGRVAIKKARIGALEVDELTCAGCILSNETKRVCDVAAARR